MYPGWEEQLEARKSEILKKVIDKMREKYPMMTSGDLQTAVLAVQLATEECQGHWLNSKYGP